MHTITQLLACRALMTCPADRTRAGEPPDWDCTELNLATDPREPWVPELRVATDGHSTRDFGCEAFAMKGASRRQNTRERVAEECSFSIRLGSIRKPPFSHA